MRALLRRLTLLAQREDGPTAVQYAMLILLAVLACLTIITAVGQRTALPNPPADSPSPPAWNCQAP